MNIPSELRKRRIGDYLDAGPDKLCHDAAALIDRLNVRASPSFLKDINAKLDFVVQVMEAAAAELRTTD